MKNMIKIPFLNTQLFITIIIACVIFAATLWYDSSSFSFNSYVTICTSNYGKPAEFIDCMQPFYNQANMDKLGIFGAAIVLFSSTLIYIFQYIRKTK